MLKSAKDMFEELGYEYEQNDVNQICVCNVNSDEWLWFYLERKTFEYNEEIYVDLLQAITQQCKELGWIK